MMGLTLLLLLLMELFSNVNKHESLIDIKGNQERYALHLLAEFPFFFGLLDILEVYEDVSYSFH